MPGPARWLRPEGEGRVADARGVGDDAEAEDAAVEGQHGGGEKQEDEVVLVAVADAVVDEDAVVVHLVHAPLAYRTVLGARWLQQAARAAGLAWVEEREVVGVVRHVLRVRGRRHDARVAVRG